MPLLGRFCLGIKCLYHHGTLPEKSTPATPRLQSEYVLQNGQTIPLPGNLGYCLPPLQKHRAQRHQARQHTHQDKRQRLLVRLWKC